ncbi:MAG: PKD domain-containing protein [Bacteroidetes bacterium]|nr:PKD domain-containing protein [Bacteroidota bacterium]
MKMKKKSFNWVHSLTLMTLAIFVLSISSCKKDDPDPDPENPVASFQFAVSETNYLEVTFTNYSENSTSYAWDFGDGGTSTDENPVYTYTEAGNYTVLLTSSNAEGTSANYSTAIQITDPLAAMRILTGNDGKTWKLYREGRAAGVGASAEAAGGYWGLLNEGGRPCVYYHEFTFNPDGSFVFDDKDSFWGENAIFGTTSINETCFEAIAANMVNNDGIDVSAWLGGTHQFVFDPSLGIITLNGTGAWMGMPQLGTTDESSIPEATRTFNVAIEEKDGFDLMVISYAYAELYWDFTYASYSTAIEPEVVTESTPFGEDLTDITPTEMKITFASRDAADIVVLDTIQSNSNIEFGATDPAGGGVLVGQFNRTAEVYQEQQFQTAPDKMDIQFDNLTTVTFDVYFPSTNDYSTTLTKTVEIGFGDISETEGGWWTAIVGQTVDETEVTLDAWKSFSFDLTDAKAATKLDMFYINIGAAGHSATGTFYIRDLVFE